jgi:ribosomal protein S27AE
MTLDEVKKKFPINSKVKLVRNSITGRTQTTIPLGSIGAVVSHDDNVYRLAFIKVKWEDSSVEICDNRIFYLAELFTTLQPEVSQPQNQCPRCKKLTMVQHHSQYCGIIIKCSSCGYC